MSSTKSSDTGIDLNVLIPQIDTAETQVVAEIGGEGVICKVQKMLASDGNWYFYAVHGEPLEDFEEDASADTTAPRLNLHADIQMAFNEAFGFNSVFMLRLLYVDPEHEAAFTVFLKDLLPTLSDVVQQAFERRYQMPLTIENWFRCQRSWRPEPRTIVWRPTT